MPYHAGPVRVVRVCVRVRVAFCHTQRSLLFISPYPQGNERLWEIEVNLLAQGNNALAGTRTPEPRLS